MLRFSIGLLALFLTGLAMPVAHAQVGCSGASPVATFKLFVKDPSFAPYPLRDVNEIKPGMKIQYQPVTIPGDDPDDARIALILAESVTDKRRQRLLILDPKRADGIAQWEVPFRTEMVALVFGPQGLSESKVGDLLEKDVSLVQQLADYAEQNQRVEDLINVLAEAERSPRPAESLDAALSGFAARYGTPMSQINREAPTSEQAMALMRTLNPALTSYDPLAPDPSTRLQQSAGLAASVAGLFWGSNVALYAGGAALFMNLRGMMFPGAEFRSALMQSGDEQKITLCAKNTQRRSRTRIAYLWAARIPDSPAPGVTLAERAHIAAGLPANVSVLLSDNALWKHLARAKDWKLIHSIDRSEVAIDVSPDAAARTLRFTPPGTAPEGLYSLAARWDWELLRVNGLLQLHRIEGGAGAILSERSRAKLVENARNVEIELEGRNFRFVEQATLSRKGDPYAVGRSVPFRLVDNEQAGAKTLFVLLNGDALKEGEYRLALKQSGGKEIAVDVPVLPEPPALTGLPLRLNLGGGTKRIVLTGERLNLIEAVEAEGVTFARAPEDRSASALRLSVTPGAALREGSILKLRLKLKDRPDPVVISDAIEVLGPLPAISSSRLSYRQENGVALRENELAWGALSTVVLTVRDGSPRQSLSLGCENTIHEIGKLTLHAGESQRDARLQIANAEMLYLTFDPGKIGQTGCRVVVRVETANGSSEPVSLGTVLRLPKLESFTLTDELAGENQYAGTLTGEDLEAIASVGWDETNGVPVSDIPRPRESDSRKQELRIALPWPSPTPRAALFIWLRDETEGRQTKVRLGS